MQWLKIKCNDFEDWIILRNKLYKAEWFERGEYEVNDLEKYKYRYKYVVWKISLGNFPHFLCYKVNRSSKLKPIY